MAESTDIPPREHLERQARIWAFEKACGMELSAPFYVGDTPDPRLVDRMLQKSRDRANEVHDTIVYFFAALVAFLFLAGDETAGTMLGGWHANAGFPAFMVGFFLPFALGSVFVLGLCTVNMVGVIRG